MKRFSLPAIRWIVPLLVLFTTFNTWSTSKAQDRDAGASFNAASLAEANATVVTKKPASGISVDNRKPAGTPDLLSPEGTGELCMWSDSTNIPVPILDQATVSQGDFLYTFAGVSDNAIIANSFRFDGTSWTSIADLPEPLEFPTAVSDGTFIYVLGGAEPTVGTPQSSTYRYDPVANAYTQLASFSTGTWNQAAVYLNGKIYKFCGSTAAGSTDALEIYDVASNSWSSGVPYPQALSFVSAFVDDGFVYGAGGIDPATDLSSDKTYRYDPVEGTWDDAAIADLPLTRWGAASSGTAYIGGWVLAGGYVDDVVTANISATAIHWDPSVNMWSSLVDMNSDRARMTGAQYDGDFYVVGGRSQASPNFVGTDSNQQLICIQDQAIITSGPVSILSEDCKPPTGVPDPGETLDVSLPLMNGGDISTVALTATLQATGGVTGPSGPVNYGAVAPDNLPVEGNFTFTVDPNLACGESITLTWTITDGAEIYPDATATFSTGVRTEVAAENMDGVTAPSLPAGWVNTQIEGTGINWVITETDPFSAPNAAFANGAGAVNSSALSTPPIMIDSSDSQLTFANNFQTELNFDGGVLEFSTDGGTTWTDIIDGGGSFVSGGYNASISLNFMSPIAGRMAWSGSSGGYIDTVVSLPASLNGHTVIFRWLMASDTSVISTGWWVDNFAVVRERECPDCGGIQTVFPDSVITTRGTFVSGNVDDLATSNNADYVIRRNGVDTIARTEFVVVGTSSTLSPASLEVMLEGAVFARSPVVQSIALLNIVSGEYEEIDSRPATNMIDSVVTVPASGDLSRFVDQTTFAVEARVRYQSVNPRQRFSSNTDKLNWMIGQ